jgi:trehalose 6-phosphate phosphatase
MVDAISTMALDLRELAVLLDVDGTILDFAPTPLEVRVPPPLHETLMRLHDRTNGALAFVSGRPLEELDHIFAPLRLPAIGGHGAEMRITADTHPLSTRRAPLLACVRRKFAALADARPGVVVEDKGYSLALHYRCAPEQEAELHSAAATIWASLPTAAIELLSGKSVIEIKQTGFNKGSAVRELMSHAPFTGRRPLFVGDDVTDRDVFALLRNRDGIAISVGEKFPGVAHHFESPADVRRWLDHISRNDELTAP